MLEKLFKKKVKSDKEIIYSPLDGKVIPLEKVPDPVFSQKLMGEGLAVYPSKGLLVSPVDGEIIQVFNTKHAIGIYSVNGLELLIHVGLETVELQGEGFNVLVKQGQKVKVGDPLLEFDIEFIKNHNKDTVTPIIITNSSEKIESIVQNSAEEVSKGEPLFTCKLKM
ncbi:PTS sugar transporter subunit IIA [Bacillus sp. JJ1764]|uniref:PTS sugar transporter subunit IIA n=1 Tax=Bacillus sp. JJ1764 TaxID=3122964 RepID=UPI002FFFC928